MKPALEMFMSPWWASSACDLLLSWFGGVKYGDPSRFSGIAAGTLVAWCRYIRPDYGGMSGKALKDSFQTFGFALPHPVIGLVLGGLHWSFLKTFW